MDGRRSVDLAAQPDGPCRQMGSGTRPPSRRVSVQEGGVGTTVKHFVANDAETERFTVNNLVGEQVLRELYLAPFEAIVKNARTWGIMSATTQSTASR